MPICVTNSGNWHTEKVIKRWWVCTPLQHVLIAQSVYLTDTANIPSVNVTAKYGSVANYTNATLARLQAWGFNTINTAPNQNLWPTASTTPNILMPFIWTAKPGLSVVNGGSIGSLHYVAKNMWGAMPSGFYTSSPFMGSGSVQVDVTDPGIATVAGNILATEADWVTIAASPHVDYLMAIPLDDADNMWGFQVDSCTGGNPTEHMGWVSVASSPLMTASANVDIYDTGHPQFINSNPLAHFKASAQGILKTQYGTIGALNTTWGTSYTTFDSSGTCVGYTTAVLTCAGGNNAAEIAAAGNGGATYSYTTAHVPDQYSLGVYIGGTLVGGVLAHDNGNGSDNPSNTVDQRVWGPYVTGTLTLATGALSVTFTTSANSSAGNRNIASISMASNIVTVVTANQHGLWSGVKVNIAGTMNYNGLALGPITVTNENTFTYALVASLATETTGTYALNTLPQAADTITVQYTYGGWAHGTGWMDENGAGLGTSPDAHACDKTTLRGGSAGTISTDIENILYNEVKCYYSGLQTQVHTYFPKAMYPGHDSISNGVPKAGILKAIGAVIAPNAPALLSYGPQFSQGQLDQWYTSCGDCPIVDSFYATATLDSPNATSLDTSVVGMFFFTQDAKGQAYYARMPALLSKSYTATRSYPYVGMADWGYYDQANDGKRWGLETPEDNAYNGHEATTASVTCSYPLQAYTCGSEAAYTQPNWVMGTSYGNLAHVVSQVSGVYYIFTTSGGTSGGSQPNWTASCPNPGNTCSDNSVTWTNQGLWTKSASPATPYGNSILSSGGGVQAANFLWLSINSSGIIPSFAIGGTSTIGGVASIH